MMMMMMMMMMMNGRVHPQKFRGVRFRKPGIWVRACVRVCVCVCVCVWKRARRVESERRAPGSSGARVAVQKRTCDVFGWFALCERDGAETHEVYLIVGGRRPHARTDAGP